MGKLLTLVPCVLLRPTVNVVLLYHNIESGNVGALYYTWARREPHCLHGTLVYPSGKMDPLSIMVYTKFQNSDLNDGLVSHRCRTTLAYIAKWYINTDVQYITREMFDKNISS